jgi:hypothetical protein
MRLQVVPVAATLALLLHSCAGGDHPSARIPQVTQNRISECGGGLRKYSGLFSRIQLALRNGELSVGVQQTLEAAFISELGRNREESVNIFKMYVDCITGSDSLDAVIAQTSSRWPALSRQLASRGIPQEILLELAGLNSLEIEAMRKHDFIAARDARNVCVKRIIKAIIDHGGSNFDGIEFGLPELEFERLERRRLAMGIL